MELKENQQIVATGAWGKTEMGDGYLISVVLVEANEKGVWDYTKALKLEKCFLPTMRPGDPIVRELERAFTDQIRSRYRAGFYK